MTFSTLEKCDTTSAGVVVPEAQVVGTGFERRPFPPGNRHIASTDAAKSGATDAANQNVAAELLEVIAVWPPPGEEGGEQC